MKRFVLTFCLSLVCAITYAQSHTVKGTVKDTKGVPVIGAIVVLEGHDDTGTVTDLDGNYTIEIPASKANGKLHVSCLSYADSHIEIGRKKVVNIVLEDDLMQLDEVVVIGYGATRRSDLTGAVTSVKVDEEAVLRNTSLDQMLEGRAVGVEVLTESEAPDAGVNIRIRGMNSFGTSMEPLYVVDGIIVNGSSDAIDLAITGDSGSQKTAVSSNGLSGINPKDIASVEILKDASATAIYGSQGANGVVLITTKMANRERPQIVFSAGLSVGTRDRSIKMLNLEQFVQLLEARGNATALETLKSIYDGYQDPSNRGRLQVTEINWQDYLTRTAISQRYYFSVSGKPKGYNYFFSLGYDNNPGIIKKTDAQTITSRLNLEKRVFKTLTLGVKFNIAHTHSNIANGSSAGGMIGGAQSILRSMLSTKPYYAQDPEAETSDIDDDETFQYGPNRWIQNYENSSDKFRIQPSAFLQWKIVPWLSFKSTIGGDYNATLRAQSRSYMISKVGNCVSIAKRNDAKYNWDDLLMTSNSWGKHKLSGTLGHSMSREWQNTKLNQGWFLEQAFGGMQAINTAAPTYSYFNYDESASSLLSFFGRVIYNYDERYILTATYRLDGSSKFSGSHKWGHFPSFAAAWRLTSEPWFHVPGISNIKLRAGWGRVGNQNITNYQSLPVYETNMYGDHSGASSDFLVGILPGNISNPDLTWETSEQVNVGLDASFFHGRISFTVDWYRKTSINLLQMKNVAHSSGFGQMAVNSGSVKNTGIEFSIEGIPVKTRHVEWQIGGNIGLNRNIITSTGSEGESGEIYLSPTEKVTAKYFVGDKLSSLATEPLNIFIEGQSMGLFYGYMVDGIVQNGETAPFFDGTQRGPGYLKYKDLDGDGEITLADRTIIGNPLPKFTYGINSSLTIDNFCLSVQLVGSYGNNIYNLNNMYDYYTGQGNQNIQAKALTEAWSESNPGGTMPGISKISSLEQTANSSFYVEDGSYLQVKNVSLSYNVPINKKKVKAISGISIGIAGSNLYTFTKYSGWTPRTRNSALKKLGVDLNSYPGQRSVALDVKLTF